LAVVCAAVGSGDRAFPNALVAGIITLVPQDLAGLEVETDRETTLIAAVGALQAAALEDHAAVTVVPARIVLLPFASLF
jgi:hypothetical protein